MPLVCNAHPCTSINGHRSTDLPRIMMNERCGHTDVCSNCGHSTTESNSNLVCPTFDDTKWRYFPRSRGELSDAERLVLKTELETLQAVSNAHAEEVDVRAKELDKLRARLALLRGQIDQRTSLLHCPIRRLPDEVMTDILVLLWNATAVLQRCHITLKKASATEAPSFLPSSQYSPPHVCHWWRRLVSQHHLLRPYFDVHIQPLMKYSTRYADELWEKLRLNFARLPYSEMHVRITNHHGRSCPNLDQQTVRCDRWRRAGFINLQWGALQDIASAHMPRLVHAKITLGSAHGDWGREVELAPNVYGRPSFFINAPCLKSITLDRKGRPDLARGRLPFALPWLQLQFVKLFQFPLQPCLEILAECQSLRSLYWWDDEDDEEDGGSHPDDYVPSRRVVNSSLTELLLVVFGFGTSGVRRLLDWSTTPCLTKLEFWAIPLPSLLPFLERSQCRLTSLSLTVSVFWASTSEIRTLLGALQDLEALTFDYCTETDESWDPHSDGETMDDILESLGAVLLDFGTAESYMERMPLPRLAEFHFLCKERCNIRCVHDFLYRCGIIQSQRTKELWVETPLKPADVADLRDSADRNRVEIYGLDKCTAMYEALPAWDWQPPVVPSSRRDDDDGPDDW